MCEGEGEYTHSLSFTILYEFNKTLHNINIISWTIHNINNSENTDFPFENVSAFQAALKWNTKSSREKSNQILTCIKMDGISVHIQMSLATAENTAAPFYKSWLHSLSEHKRSYFIFSPSGSYKSGTGGKLLKRRTALGVSMSAVNSDISFLQRLNLLKSLLLYFSVALSHWQAKNKDIFLHHISCGSSINLKRHWIH